MQPPLGYEHHRSLHPFEAWDRPDWKDAHQPPRFMTHCETCGWVDGEAVRRWIDGGAYYDCPKCGEMICFNRIEP